MYSAKIALVVLCLSTHQVRTEDESGDIDSKIVNGSPAAPNQFPYTARVWSTSGIRCGGSILSRRWVLTAAHCIKNNTSYLVCVGYNDFNNCTRFPAKLVIVHPQYNIKGMLENDIALIQTVNPMVFSKSVNFISLPPPRDYPINATLVVSGWGLTAGNGNLAKTLQFIRVRNLSPAEAAQRGIPITPQQIGTLGWNGGGSCFGDSGGPLASTKNPPTLEGITSYGISKTCELGLPKVGTNVAKYLTWINQIRAANP